MNGKANLNISVVVCVFMMIFAGSAGAVTYYVNPGESIQAAIDDVNDGDEIEVAPGTYNEAIDFKGKAVRLYSSGGPDVTTIDATGLSSSVVQCTSGEGPNTILTGFTITGGTGTPDEYTQLCGGGMIIYSSSPTVTNCTFTSNSAEFGGGVFNYASSATVSDCTFTSNTVSQWGAGLYNNNSSPTVTNCTFSSNASTGFGGGMYNGNSSNPAVSDCNFTNNSAQEGGGMHNGSSSNPTVSDCTFSNNTANWGGGMYSHTSSPTVTDCVFSGNDAITSVATGYGGGMHNNWYSSPAVTNCVFNGNTADVRGGGMYNYDYSEPTVTNCTFSGNTAGTSGGGISNVNSSVSSVINCILWDDTPDEIFNSLSTAIVSYCDVQGGWGGTGNIDANPLFVNAAGGDLRLSSSASPCVDAGNNSAPGLPATDLVGNPRVVDGDGSGTAMVDMGAYELQGKVHNITLDRLYETIQASINDALNGNQIEVAPGTYNEAIDFKGKAVRLYSSGGPDVTIIDATGLSSSVVKCTSGEGLNTILTGFTITGGTGTPVYADLTYGGGMYNNASSPTVINCIFTGNSVTGDGGGMYNEHESSPTVTNCIFSANYANYAGGGMDNRWDSSPTVKDCTFNGNTARGYGGGMENFHNSNSTVTNCTFSGNTATYYSGGGIYNVQSSPVVTNCILWGDSPDEVDNNASTIVVTYCDIQGGYSGTGNIDADPLFVDVAAGDLRLSSSISPCVDAGNNSAPGLPATDLEGNPRVWDGDGDGNSVVDMGAYEFGAIKRIRNTRTERMYAYIQMAIDDSEDCDEIEVAPGAYYEAINFKGKAVRLYSSGGPDVTTIDANGIIGAYHVVQCISGEDANTILDGFTITGGNANGIDETEQGGGMYNNSSSPSVTNCIFRGNKAGYGGGILNDDSSPIINNCNFIDNTAMKFGGGMENYNGGSPTVTDCTFSGNTAENGGGMLNNGSSPTVTKCTFSSNKASTNGGGMYNFYNSSPIVKDCTFSDNTASNHAGGMCNSNSNSTVTNCIFKGNASSAGGGMFNGGGDSTAVTNCVFSGNSAGYGAGMWNYGSSPTLTNCTFSTNVSSTGGGMYNEAGSNATVNNCILWGDTPNEIINRDSSPIVTYSDVQGVYSGTGNIDIDPCFVDPYNPDPNLWNLRLQPDSPCIDAGNTTAVPGGTWADIGGNPRVSDNPQIPDTGISLFGLTVDIGAYEFHCSGIPGDINCDGVVNFKDIAVVASNWLAGTEPEL